jgi:hypothetical protein
LPGLVDAATGQEKVPGGAALAAADDDSDEEEDGVSKAEGRWRTVAQTLVGEVVLATKEVRQEQWVHTGCLEGGSQQRMAAVRRAGTAKDWARVLGEGAMGGAVRAAIGAEKVSLC